MSAFTVTAEFASAKERAPGGIINAEAFQALVDRGFEDVSKEVFDVVQEMEAVVNVENVKYTTGKGISFPELADKTIPISRDEDSPSYSTGATGFEWEYDTNPFRRFIKFGRDAIEQDIDIGFANAMDRVEQLLKIHTETTEAWLADVFNRGDGDGGAGSQCLSPDGGYLLDSDRPNPDLEAGSWGNLEAEGDLTQDTVFQAAYNARMSISSAGRLTSNTIKSMMIPAAWEGPAFTLFQSNQLIGTNYNDASWASSKFNMDQVKVMSRLTSPIIYYWLCDPKSKDNPVRLAKFSDVKSKTWWGLGDNPDIMLARIRSRWGVYLRNDGRKALRGGRLAADS